MNVTRIHPLSEIDWDDRFEGVAPAGICQSHFYGRIMARALGADPVYLVCSDAGTDVGYLLLIDRRTSNGKSRCLEWIDGPVILPSEADSLAVARAFLSWITPYASQSSISRIDCLGFPRSSPLSPLPAMVDLLAGAGFRPRRWSTSLIALRRPEDEIWASFDRVVRKSLRKCQKLNLGVHQIESFKEFRELFYPAYAPTKENSTAMCRSLDRFETEFGEDVRRRFTYLVAMDGDGEALGTLGFHTFGGTATEVASALTPRAVDSRFPAQDLLHWEAIRLSRQMGCHTFDLSGFNPEAEEGSKEKGIARFKTKWGGSQVDFFQYFKELGYMRHLKQLRRFAVRTLGATRTC